MREVSGSSRHWWMVGVLLLLSVLCYVDRFLIAIMVDPIKSTLRLSDFQMGLILGPAFALSYAFFGFPAGWAADRFSRRIVILLGVVCWSIATSLCGMTNTFTALLLARVAVGIGEATLTPAAYSMIADGFPRRWLTTAMAIFSAGPKWGQAAAYAVGGLLLTGVSNAIAKQPDRLGSWEAWQLTFIIVGVPGLLAALLCLTFPEPERRGMPLADDCRQAASTLPLFLWQNKRLIGCLLTGFTFMTVVANAIYMWVPTYMTREFEWTAAQYGAPLGAMGLIVAATFLFHGTIVDHLATKRGVKAAGMHYYIWLLAASVPIAAITFTVRDPFAFLGLLGAFQIVALPFMLVMSASVISILPNTLRGQLTATFGFFMSVVGIAASPVIVGAITDYVFQDEQKIGWSLAIVTTVGCAGSLIAFRLSLKPLVELTIRRDNPFS